MSEEEHSSPHDALFKRVFGRTENAAPLLACLLPPTLAAQVEWGRLELLPGTYVDPHLAELESDLLFAAPLAGRAALFYVLLEHQSSVDRTMPWRLWRYVTRIWERQAKTAKPSSPLPRIVPIVLYQGVRPWTAPMNIAQLIDIDATARDELDDIAPRLGYLVDDLRALDAAALRARALSAFGALALWSLRTAADRSFGESIAMFADLFDVVLREDGPEAIHTLLRYLSIITHEDDDLVESVVALVSEPVRSEAMNNHYNRLLREGLEKGREEGLRLGREAGREQGLKEGREEGREEGRLEGRATLLAKQIALKFGEPGPEVRARLQHASALELERWAERILTAERLDDVLA